MSEAGEVKRRIGAGGFAHASSASSSEWFPEFVTPQTYLDYWNDVDGVYRPVLARHWLSRGFDSDPLRWLAGLDDLEAHAVTTEQLLAVLNSLGVATETRAAFLERCARAIARIQPDLDSTGLSQYRMQPKNASPGRDNLPSVYAALPDGSWWSSGSTMTWDMDDESLVLVAAESVSDTLIEMLRVVWPLCPQHTGPPITLQPRDDDPVPAWFCHRGKHDVARLGELKNHV